MRMRAVMTAKAAAAALGITADAIRKLERRGGVQAEWIDVAGQRMRLFRREDINRLKRRRRRAALRRAAQPA